MDFEVERGCGWICATLSPLWFTLAFYGSLSTPLFLLMLPMSIPPLHNNLHLRNENSDISMDFLLVVTCLLRLGLDVLLLLLRNCL